MNKGQSVVEVMLAAGLFVIFSAGIVTAVLGGLDNNRVAGEQTIANQLASEGLEAVRSIKNQAYTNLVNSTGTGVAVTGGVWSFSGTNNIFDKYTRVITVNDVLRDINGNIVASGGTLDPDTKKVISTVSWNVNSARANSVVLTTYLTNWGVGGGTPTTCNDYAIQQGYAGGTCRQNTTQCTNHGETHLSAGDVYCTVPAADICCNLPVVTPTPTPTSTSAPTPTAVPITTCTQYCGTVGYGAGTCRQNATQCSNNGESYQSGGNIYCTGGPSADTCCCR